MKNTFEITEKIAYVYDFELLRRMLPVDATERCYYNIRVFTQQKTAEKKEVRIECKTPDQTLSSSVEFRDNLSLDDLRTLEITFIQQLIRTALTSRYLNPEEHWNKELLKHRIDQIKPLPSSERSREGDKAEWMHHDEYGQSGKEIGFAARFFKEERGFEFVNPEPFKNIQWDEELVKWHGNEKYTRRFEGSVMRTVQHNAPENCYTIKVWNHNELIASENKPFECMMDAQLYCDSLPIAPGKPDQSPADKAGIA